MISKKRILMVFLSGMFFLSFFSIPAYAYDFTFTVPVELRNIPTELYSWFLQASVYDGEKNQIGLQGTLFRVTKHYKKDFVFRFNAQTGKNPASAKYYKITLYVNAKTPDKVMYQNGPYPYDSSKPFKWTTGFKKIPEKK